MLLGVLAIKKLGWPLAIVSIIHRVAVGVGGDLSFCTTVLLIIHLVSVRIAPQVDERVSRVYLRESPPVATTIHP